MDPTAVVGIALGAVALGMLFGVRKRVTHLEHLVLRLQDRVTTLEYPKPASSPGADPAPIDVEPFVD